MIAAVNKYKNRDEHVHLFSFQVVMCVLLNLALLVHRQLR